MSVVIETTLGDITVDLFLKTRPRACLNFLKLCKIKYYNFSLFHTIDRNFIAQTGDPTGSRKGGESIFGVLEGPLKRYFEAEKNPRIKHTNMGLISFVGNDNKMIGSQFFFTLGTDLTYLDETHCVFGEVVEGLDVLEILNEAICDTDNRPYQDIRITHTVILDDPFPDPKQLKVPSRSPSPSAERLQGGRIAPDEEIDETMGKSAEEVVELIAEKEAKARATILEMVGDIPDAEMAPPENVLFVCKLNPVTTDDDLEIIFSRFGKIKSCEIIRDKKTGDSLQYAFVEFEDQKSCEDAYFKMDNVLIDDRRIHVDFSQSVAKVRWHGKGRGVTTYDEKGRKNWDSKNDIGNGRYKSYGSKNKGSRESYRDRNIKGSYRGKNNRDIERNKQRYDRDNERYDRDSQRYNKEMQRYNKDIQRYDKDHQRFETSRDRNTRYDVEERDRYKETHKSSNPDRYKSSSSQKYPEKKKPKKEKSKKKETSSDSDSSSSESESYERKAKKKKKNKKKKSKNAKRKNKRSSSDSEDDSSEYERKSKKKTKKKDSGSCS